MMWMMWSVSRGSRSPADTCRRQEAGSQIQAGWEEEEEVRVKLFRGRI